MMMQTSNILKRIKYLSVIRNIKVSFLPELLLNTINDDYIIHYDIWISYSYDECFIYVLEIKHDISTFFITYFILSIEGEWRLCGKLVIPKICRC